MKNIFIFTLLLLFSFNTYAFEVYGLKSGITKTEFYELTNCQAYIDNYNANKSQYSKAYSLKNCHSNPSRVDTSLEYFKGVSPIMYAQWTHDDRLWRVQLYFYQADDMIESLAQRRALTESHPGKEIQQSNGSLVVTYIDEALFNVSEEYYFQEHLEKYNNKK